jgi:hypothetical protein
LFTAIDCALRRAGGLGVVSPAGSRNRPLPISRLIQECSLNPDEVSHLVLAYEAALELLRPKDRTDAVKEVVAKKIFEIARSGERDAPKICARALIELGLPIRA